MNVNRERQLALIEQCIFDIDGLTLAEVESNVAKAIELYGPLVDDYTPPYSDITYQYIRKNVPESDDEMARRILREVGYASRCEQQDRAEYERLKAKFG